MEMKGCIIEGYEWSYDSQWGGWIWWIQWSDNDKWAVLILWI